MWLYKRSVTTVTRVNSWDFQRNGVCCSCSTEWHTWRCSIRISKYIYKGQSHGCLSRHNYYHSKNSISTNFAKQSWTRECRTILRSLRIHSVVRLPCTTTKRSFSRKNQRCNQGVYTSSQVILVMLTTKWSVSNATMTTTFQMTMNW